MKLYALLIFFIGNKNCTKQKQTKDKRGDRHRISGLLGAKSSYTNPPPHPFLPNGVKIHSSFHSSIVLFGKHKFLRAIACPPGRSCTSVSWLASSFMMFSHSCFFFLLFISSINVFLFSSSLLSFCFLKSLFFIIHFKEKF